MNRYIITNQDHTELEGFEGTWQELRQYVLEHYTEAEFCCVKEFHNTEIGYDWEEITATA